MRSARLFPSLFPSLLCAMLLIGPSLVACGDDSTAPPAPASSSSSSAAPTVPDPTSPSPSTTSPDTTGPATTRPATTQPSTTGPPAPTTSSPQGLEQPAIWPASDIAFATPTQAAEDFVGQVLGVPPELGEFMAGDGRSGEIEVFSPGEGGPGSRVVRSLLLLRQLGPDDGWFVIAAIGEGVVIDAPSNGATVPAGRLDVSGLGRGFEATIIVKAFVAGDPTPLVEPVIAAGGALETPEPFTATLDLGGVASGSTVTILVRGDAGLETDPGEFSAIAVTID
jgi:hypothetical protein